MLQAAIRVGDANRPRVNKLRMAFDYLNTQRGVTLYTVVGRDGANDGVHPRHDRLETKFRRHIGQPIDRGVAHLARYFGAFNQGLAWDTSKIKTVTAHLLGLNQGHLGLYRGADVGRHQSGSAATNDDEIAVKGFGTL